MRLCKRGVIALLFALVLVSAARAADSTPPTVSLVTVSGPITVVEGVFRIYARASDDTAIARIELLIDGVVRVTGSQVSPFAGDTSAPYFFDWDTTNQGTHACIGSHQHTLVARAFDEAGNFALSGPATVEMNDPPYCPSWGVPFHFQLTWIDNADNELGFYVFEVPPNGISFRKAILPPDAMGFEINEYAPIGTNKCYELAAYNAIGQSTRAGPVCKVVGSTAPNAPTNVMVQ